MPKIISVVSFRAGTGRSTLVANLATLLALQGLRVGVLDTDFQFPGVYTRFCYGANDPPLDRALVNYLWSEMPIEATAFALHERDDAERPFLKQTQLWLIPAVRNIGDSARILREGYDVGLLHDGIERLVSSLALDYLIIDTPSGVRDETVLMIAESDVLVVVFHPDRQDYQGTGAIVEIARKLDGPKLRLVVNNVPLPLDFEDVKARVEQTYNCPVAGLLPWAQEVESRGSSNVFAAIHPDHPWSNAMRAITETVIDAAE